MGEDQGEFVDSNLYAIAEAGIEGYVPYAVYAGETMVGMVVLGEFSEETAMVHHVMIDSRYQGRGHGRAVMLEAIRLARERYRCRRLVLSYWPGNPAARLYESLGFEYTGEKWGDEPVMGLDL
ncbi:MAG: GNAT family N-acetyltransferase [Rubrobacteraceae bacterium]